MLKARKGNLLIFGLSDLNVERLKEGKPISFNGKDLKLPEFDILIFHAKDEEAMYRLMEEQIGSKTEVINHVRSEHEVELKPSKIKVVINRPGVISRNIANWFKMNNVKIDSRTLANLIIESIITPDIKIDDISIHDLTYLCDSLISDKIIDQANLIHLVSYTNFKVKY